MYSDNLAINVTGLSKCYNIYDEPLDRLKQSIVPKILNLFGRPVRTYYHEFWALRNLTLDVKQGETIGVIGRNGSGKSTLLQMICGTLTPTSGNIETKGRITALLELGSGFNPEFTGRENVFLNGAILGLRQDEIEARFDAIVGFADIGKFIEQPVKFYSSGMTVRLAFAVQAMVDPDILIVDEALAVGDEMFQRKCFHRLDELKRNGTSILFVSHSGSQIIELCDRALLLEQGQRLLLSDPLKVVRAYHKMIYANFDEQVRLIQEIKELDQDDAKQNVRSISTLGVHAISHMKSDDQIFETDFYESDMKPQSTVTYPIQGAMIESIKIFNKDGEQVNNLLAGRDYIFEMQGTFFDDKVVVDLGFFIHSITDIRVAGHNYLGTGKKEFFVKNGQRFRFIQKIKMDLTPNTYFVGGAIWSSDEPVCLHRVVDIIMFRVLNKVNSNALGFVDLATDEPELEIIG